MDYLKFFGFTDAPFRLAPDPQYFFPSYSHQEALQTLLYSVRAGEGFIQITGDPGTGKTLLLRTLLKELGTDVQTALILNPNLTPDDLLRVILDDFALTNDDAEIFSRPKDQLIRIFRDFLLEKTAAGCKAVIIVDEAQNLPLETIEELRLLSNLETDKQKLLQIFLVGQRELEQKIEDPGLRQLSQRITIRYVLTPFSEAETATYIKHRLKIAAPDNQVTFSRAIINQVYKFSQGTPRLINIVCERCLMAAYIDGQSHIETKHFASAVRSIKGTTGAPTRPAAPNQSNATGKWLLFGLVFSIIVLVLVLGWQNPKIRQFAATIGASANPTKVQPPQPQAPMPAPAMSVKNQDSKPAATRLKAQDKTQDILPAPTAPPENKPDPAKPKPKPPVAESEKPAPNQAPATAPPPDEITDKPATAAVAPTTQVTPESLPKQVLKITPGFPLLLARPQALKADLWLRENKQVKAQIKNHLQLPPGIEPGLWLAGIKDGRAFLFNPTSFPFRPAPPPPVTWPDFFRTNPQSVMPLMVMPKPIANSAAPSPNPETIAQLQQFFQNWVAAWRQLDLDTFMSFYGPVMTFYKPDSFQPFSYDKIRLRAVKKALFEKTVNLKLELSAPTLLIDPRNPELAMIFFYQDYRSNHYHDQGYKTLFLSRIPMADAPKQWQIVAKFFVPVKHKWKK